METPLDALTENLMPIGQFPRMTRLSIKALRLYDEIDLLRPNWVDERSGYRYYSPEQVERAEAIRTLRAMDMPLDEARQVLMSGPETSGRVLENHRRRLVNRLIEDERRLSFLSELIDGRKQLMAYDISVKAAEDQQVARFAGEGWRDSRRPLLRAAGQDQQRQELHQVPPPH